MAGSSSGLLMGRVWSRPEASEPLEVPRPCECLSPSVNVSPPQEPFCRECRTNPLSTPDSVSGEHVFPPISWTFLSQEVRAMNVGPSPEAAHCGTSSLFLPLSAVRPSSLPLRPQCSLTASLLTLTALVPMSRTHPGSTCLPPKGLLLNPRGVLAPFGQGKVGADRDRSERS